MRRWGEPHRRGGFPPAPGGVPKIYRGYYKSPKEEVDAFLEVGDSVAEI